MITDKNSIIKETNEKAAQAERESIIEKIEADLYSERVKTGNTLSKAELKELIQEKGYNKGELGEDSFVTKDGEYTINYDEIVGWENKITDILEVGDYVDYIYDDAEDYELETNDSGYIKNQTISQDKGMKWRVLNINSDGSFELISETSTSIEVGFKGTTGYRKGVWILNDICKKQYSNSSLGVSARSINIEDLEKDLTEVGEKARDEYESNVHPKYKHIQRYTANSGEYPNITQYPRFYAQENGSGVESDVIKTDGINLSDSGNINEGMGYGTANDKGLTVTNTFYAMKLDNINYKSISPLLICNSSEDYWVASRWAGMAINSAGTNGPEWGLRSINENTLSGKYMFIAGFATDRDESLCLRPVVPVNIKVNVTGGDGTIENPYIIK